MSKPAKVITLAVVIGGAALEMVAYVVYRNSTDGQTPALWVFIALYAGLLIGGIKIADSAVHRLLSWLRRS
jgi:hypothetical protein